MRQSSVCIPCPGTKSADTAHCQQLLLTIRESATCLSVSRAHVYRLIQTGELSPVHSRGAVRVPYSELERYVAALITEGR